jgi:hypothetical protein
MAGRYLGVSELWVSLVKEVLHRYVMRPVAAVAAAITLMGFHSCVSDQMPTNVCCWEARQPQGRGWTFQSLLDPLAYHFFKVSARSACQQQQCKAENLCWSSPWLERL